MKKKGIALVLVLALALTLIGVAVATDPESNLTMETSKTEVDDRDTFTVTVKNKAATFNALTFYVEFPTEDLEVIDKGVTWTLDGESCCVEPTVNSSVVAGGASTPDEANASGKIGFYYLDVAESGDGKAYSAGALQAVITFRVKEVHTEGKDRNSTGEAAITLHEDSEGTNGLIALLNKWLNDTAAKVSFTKQALAYVLGDLNGDNYINETDSEMLYKHIMGTEMLAGVQTDAADLNKDGFINETDSEMLYKHIMGTELLPNS